MAWAESDRNASSYVCPVLELLHSYPLSVITASRSHDLLPKSRCPPLVILNSTQSKNLKWTRSILVPIPGKHSCLYPWKQTNTVWRTTSLDLLYKTRRSSDLQHPFHSHRRLKHSLDLDRIIQKKKKTTTQQSTAWQVLREKNIVKSCFLWAVDSTHKKRPMLKLMEDNVRKWHLTSAISACNKEWPKLFN